MFWQKITDKFISVVWLVENALWRFSNDVIYNQKKERCKKILSEVYWFKDIYEFMPAEVEQENLDKFLRTVFNHQEQQQNLESNNKNNGK